MTSVKRTVGAAAIGTAMVIGSGLSAPPAQAGYIVTLEQVGSNVVATGSGAIDLTGLIFGGEGLDLSGAEIMPRPGRVGPLIITGPTGPLPTDVYRGPGSSVSGPTSFGSGDLTSTSIGSGDHVGLTKGIDAEGGFTNLLVPAGYVFDSLLSDTSTYLNQTFATLGVTPGTYVWTWGTGAHADTFTLEIGAVPAIPEPASLAVLSIALAGLGVVRRRTQKYRMPRSSLTS
jgi:hypothetical protein